MIKSTTTLSDSTNRNLSLDVIRGFAVIGMIFINILVFVPDITSITWNDSTGETITERTIYKLIYLLFHGKMRALFALLFGVGIILFFQQKTNTTINKSDYFSRRMLWLIIFGLIHAYILLWSGSILFEYAVCGLLLFSLRALNAKPLLALSIFVLSFYIYLNSKDYSKFREIYTGYEKALQMESAHQIVSDELVKKKEQFERYLEKYPPLSKAKQDELDANKQANIKLYTSDLITIYKQNINTTNEALSFGVYLNILESIGTMLLGMALFKLGFFDFKLKKYIYFLFIFIGIPVGMYLYLLLYNWQGCTKTELIEIYSWKSFSSFPIEGLSRIILALGYCALLLCTCRLTFLKPVLVFLGHVGRMAFSNYVMQTVICVIFFYALKYYGSLNMTGLTIFAGCIVLFQLIASYFCVNYFDSGPIEYTWRKLAQKKLPESDTTANCN